MDSIKNHDPVEIVRGLKLILEPRQVTELRVLDAVTPADRRPHIESGYFDDIDRLAEAAVTVKTAKGFYFVPNAVDPALLARAVNRIRPAGKEPTTADHGIVARRWLLIDCDVNRPAGISSSDAEHKAAIKLAFKMRAELSDEGWPAPIIGDSGNGAHVMYRIDQPAEDAGLVKRCLEALAARFDTAHVTVDQSVFNPARIWKLPGTLVCKGDNTPERPHRMARILEAPGMLAIVDTVLLESLAAASPGISSGAKTEPSGKGSSRGQSFDIDKWIQEHKLEVDGPEPWQSGRRWVFRVCPWNSDHANRSAFLIQQASGAKVAGCHHNSCQGKDWHALRDLVEPGWRDGKKQLPALISTTERTIYRPVLTRLADVQPEPVQWLWPGRIALGKLTLIAGDPGLGKSFVSLDLSARVSLGAPWPDDRGVCAPLGGVVLLTAEDGLADTVRPRLDAMGADVGRIVALEAVQGDDRLPVNLQRDLAALEEAIDSVADCRLVVVDPISAYLGRVDSHNNADIRALLHPLGDLAERHKVAIVAITHLNKGNSGSALYRATGSLAFIAAARAAWLVAKDQDDPRRRLFLPAKNNLAGDVLGMAFDVAEGMVRWEPEPVAIDADKALGPGGSDHVGAVDWLRQALADGPVDATELQAQARENCITTKQLWTAKQTLKVQSRKMGFGDGWQWFISQDSQESLPDEQGIFGIVRESSADAGADGGLTERSA
jgi:hypothetical protein